MPNIEKKAAQQTAHQPDALQHGVAGAMEKFQERKRYFTFVAAGAFVLAIVAIWFANRPPAAPSAIFSSIWDRYQVARDLLELDLSAAKEIESLETQLEEVRGTETEAYALWLLAISHYREALSSEKVRDEQRRPHFDKAIRYLDELREPEFDPRLIKKSGWFVGGGTSPIALLRARVESDAKWSETSSYNAPRPASDVVAVLRTELGDIHLQFYAEQSPEHTNNFVTLCRKGTYNGTALGYVFGGRDDPVGVRGGDPYSFFYPDPLKKEQILRWGQGGVGKLIAPEAGRELIRHVEGTVSAVRTSEGDWDNGALFRIATTRDRELDHNNTPFALVVDGLDIVSKTTQRKLASEHPPYEEEMSFRSFTARSLLVEPVRIHKAIVYKDGIALEHAFPLPDGEKRLDTLKNTKAAALPDKDGVAYCGRKLLEVDEGVDETAETYGLHIPFPPDLAKGSRGKDDEAPNPLGGRKPLTLD